MLNRHTGKKGTVFITLYTFSGLFYKSELYPIEIDSKSKLSRIIGQRFSKKEKGKKKRHINEVLVTKKSGNAEWVPLNKFISE